jgi:hypothetical protein
MTTVKEVINGALGLYGYEISKKNSRRPHTNGGFTLYKYRKENGSFDYEEYRRIQAEANKRKIDRTYVKEENIEFVSQYLKRKIGTPKFGICHGTRRGLEQEWFAKRLGCKVIGTEISDTAEQFPNTIQWDFHEIQPEWIGNVDFIYSNSLDHSYDPEKCVNAWMTCIRPDGYCIIEWHNGGEEPSLSDPFTCEINQLTYLITMWGKGSYCVREIVPTPTRSNYVSFMMIYKF